MPICLGILRHALHSTPSEAFYLNILMGNVGNSDIFQSDCQKFLQLEPAYATVLMG